MSSSPIDKQSYKAPLIGGAPVVGLKRWVDAVGRRDFDAARQGLAPDFEMVFPGGGVMRDLAELPAWAATRYQSVSKHYERFEQAWQGDQTVVFCSGTLQGRWLDGTAFEGVRFVDRFELAGRRIHRQEVWNDLAEARAGRPAGA
jgi:hypothetical protein